MREILFRAKQHYTKEWLYGAVVKDGDECLITVGEPDGLYKQKMTVVEESTVGQFTGLVDRNGKRIFEGDIIKITDHTIEETFESCGELVTMLMTRTYEVFWNTTKWSIKLIEPMLGVDPPIFDLPTKNVTYEIIGNIHDNPELVEAR